MPNVSYRGHVYTFILDHCLFVFFQISVKETQLDLEVSYMSSGCLFNT